MKLTFPWTAKPCIDSTRCVITRSHVIIVNPSCQVHHTVNVPLARVHTLAHSFVLDEDIGEMEFDTDSPSRKHSFAEANAPRVSQSSTAFSSGTTSLPGSSLAKQQGGYTPSSRSSSTDKLPISNPSTPASQPERRPSGAHLTTPPQQDISASSIAVSPVLPRKSKDDEIADYRAQAALETQRQLKELQLERDRQRTENEVSRCLHNAIHMRKYSQQPCRSLSESGERTLRLRGRRWRPRTRPSAPSMRHNVLNARFAAYHAVNRD